MGMTSTLETVIVMVGAAFIVAGMFMVFIILFQFMDGLTSNTNTKILYNLVNMKMLLFILAGISTIFHFIPMFATIIMGALFLIEVLFLMSYYYIFLNKNKKHT